MAKIGKNGQISVFSGHFLCNPSSGLHENLCAGVSNDYLTTSFCDQIDMVMLPLLIFSKNWKNCQIIFLIPIFTTRGAPDPKVMGTIESGLLSCFFWHLEKSDQTYGSWDIKCWENSGAAVAAGAAGAAVGVQ